MTKPLTRVMAMVAFAIGSHASLAAAQPVNLMQPTRRHRPDLDAIRKDEEKRQRKAAARRR